MCRPTRLVVRVVNRNFLSARRESARARARESFAVWRRPRCAALRRLTSLVLDETEMRC